MARPLEREDSTAAARFDSADPPALLRRANRLLDDAQAILTRAANANDDRLALQAVREVRSSLELVMKAHGMLAPDGAVTVNVDARRLEANLGKLSVEELRAIAYGKPLAIEDTNVGRTAAERGAENRVLAIEGEIA